MNDTPLPADLRSILARTAASGMAGRPLRAASAEEALGAVLDAIATCVAPRVLTVTEGDRPLIRVLAAAGRLALLLDVAPSARPTVEGAMNRALHAADLPVVADLLAQLFPGEQCLAFRSAAPEDMPDPTAPGLSCAALMSHLHLCPFDAAGIDRLSYLLEAAEEILIAVIHHGQPPRLLRADSPPPPGLVQRIDTVLGDPGRARWPGQDNDILFLDLADHPDLALGLTGPVDAPVALLLDADGMADIAAFWAMLPHVPVARTP